MCPEKFAATQKFTSARCIHLPRVFEVFLFEKLVQPLGGQVDYPRRSADDSRTAIDDNHSNRFRFDGHGHVRAFREDRIAIEDHGAVFNVTGEVHVGIIPRPFGNCKSLRRFSHFPLGSIVRPG